jgi:hypothetical protein
MTKPHAISAQDAQRHPAASIDAHVVYARDSFRVRLGNGFAVENEPYLEDDRGPIKELYAFATLAAGGTHGIWMNKHDLTPCARWRTETHAHGRDSKRRWLRKLWRSGSLPDSFA